MQLANPAELIQSFVQPFVVLLRSMDALIERTGDAGRPPIGNAETVYSRPLDEGKLPEQIAADLAALNAGIERLARRSKISFGGSRRE